MLSWSWPTFCDAVPASGQSRTDVSFFETLPYIHHYIVLGRTHPAKRKWWTNVCDAGPTFTQHCLPHSDTLPLRSLFAFFHLIWRELIAFRAPQRALAEFHNAASIVPGYWPLIGHNIKAWASGHFWRWFGDFILPSSGLMAGKSRRRWSNIEPGLSFWHAYWSRPLWFLAGFWLFVFWNDRLKGSCLLRDHTSDAQI